MGPKEADSMKHTLAPLLLVAMVGFGWAVGGCAAKRSERPYDEAYDLEAYRQAAELQSMVDMAKACYGGGGRQIPGMTDRVWQTIDMSCHGRSYWEWFDKTAISAVDLKGGRPDWFDADFTRYTERWFSEEIEAAAAYVRSHPDMSSYIPLLILQKREPGIYTAIPEETKARILCDALAKMIFLNEFGAPGDHPAGDLLVGVGKTAIPFLRKMLDNPRKVFLPNGWVGDPSRGQYRRADYACLFLTRILGRKPNFSEDPKERDKQIAALKIELQDPAEDEKEFQEAYKLLHNP
jgi:hypothetical protein